MTKEELKALIGSDDKLMKTLDVKTLVLDLVREMTDEELLAIFWEKLPSLSDKQIKDYLFMTRP